VKHLWLVIALGACGKKHEQEAKPQPVVKATSRDMLDIYTGCWDVQSRGDMKALAACYAENARTESPGAGFPAAVGVTKILEAADSLRHGFPDLKGSPELVLGNGDNVAAIVRLSGTSADSKKPIGLAGGVFVKFDKAHGVILEESDYFDSATIAGQLQPDPSHPVRAWNETPTLAFNKITAANDQKEKANVTLVSTLLGEFNRHDLGAFGALIGDDATWSDAAEAKDWTKAELLADHAVGLKAFSDLSMSTIYVWGAGDYVVQTGEITGTNDGLMPGITAPTKKKISIPYMGVFQVANGKVAHAWVFEQGSAFVTQLGLK